MAARESAPRYRYRNEQGCFYYNRAALLEVLPECQGVPNFQSNNDRYYRNYCFYRIETKPSQCDDIVASATIFL